MAILPEFGERTPGVPLLHRSSAYVVVQDSAGAIAVMRTPKGHYLPGGGVDAGETADRAAAREAREEAGLIITVPRFLARAMQYTFSPDEAACFAKGSMFFTASVLDTCLPRESDHALLWMLPADALRALTPESHRWAVQQTARR